MSNGIKHIHGFITDMDLGRSKSLEGQNVSGKIGRSEYILLVGHKGKGDMIEAYKYNKGVNKVL